MGDFWGPLANEIRARLDHLSMGGPCVLTTPEEARKTLEVTLAMERSVQSREAVRLPLGGLGGKYNNIRYLALESGVTHGGSWWGKDRLI